MRGTTAKRIRKYIARTVPASVFGRIYRKAKKAWVRDKEFRRRIV